MVERKRGWERGDAWELGGGVASGKAQTGALMGVISVEDAC